MYCTQKIGNDLKDVLETLDELKRTIEEQAKARVQLEAEKAALGRRLSEALAAEHRQRCEATASRAIAKRAQAATQPVIAANRELVSLKRELAAQKKNFQDEKKILEAKVSFLQKEIIRIKEENEAALAAVEFAKEVAADVSKNASPPTSTSTPLPPPPPPPSPPPPPPEPQLQSLPLTQPTSGHSLWTGSGQLIWKPSPVNLTSMTSDRRRPKLSIRPLMSPRTTSPCAARYPPVAGFRTATYLMAPHINEVSDSQVSQSCADGNKRCQSPESEDDCVIVGGTELSEETDHTETWTEMEAEINDENGFNLTEERDSKESACMEEESAHKISLRKSKKKRKMYIKPFHDNFIA